MRLKVEVCFSPKLFCSEKINENYIVVVADILRATTTICTAFQYGVASIIPAGTVSEAKTLKENGYSVAAEQEGLKLDFADYENSAFQFMNSEMKGKDIVHFTTNGISAILLAKNASSLVIGAFSNIAILSRWLKGEGKNIYILCSGWKGEYCLEDALFAGALTERLLESADFVCHSDSGNAAFQLWKTAQDNVLDFVQQASHVHRLQKLGLGDIIPYSFEMNTCPVIPILKNGIIVKNDMC